MKVTTQHRVTKYPQKNRLRYYQQLSKAPKLDETIEGKKIMCHFSCGVASAAATRLAIDLYGEKNSIFIAYSYVADEHEDNLRFLRDCQDKLFGGREVKIIRSHEYGAGRTADVFDKEGWMTGSNFSAPCTVELKVKPGRAWDHLIAPDYEVFGFTFEEIDRHLRFVEGERDNLLPLLIHYQFTKQRCAEYVESFGIRLPYFYSLGFSNANCVGCVKVTSPTYWNAIRQHFPQVFDQRAEQSRRLNTKLVRHKGDMLYLDELSPEAKGRALKSIQVKCGYVCEEYVEPDSGEGE